MFCKSNISPPSQGGVSRLKRDGVVIITFKTASWIIAWITYVLIFVISLTGPSLYAQEKSSQTINIGLLIQDSTCTSVVQAAELAVAIANRKGGMNGRQFRLRVRSMEGPWGTGSKQAVDLIFNEHVWALVGSHDGRNAHLVEQAATKSQVVFISAWSGDPTLSQAFVPWFFNCVPNDRQQAESLTDEIFRKRKIGSVSVVSEGDYDSKLARDNFLRQVRLTGNHEPVQFSLDEFKGKINELAEMLKKINAGCLVLFCHPAAAEDLIGQMMLKGISTTLFGSLMILNENELQLDRTNNFNDRILVPSGTWSGTELEIFRKEFLDKYHVMPGIAACYSYDATCVLLEAIKTAGKDDREEIQKSLAAIKFKGVTGPVLFDGKGNRSGNFEIRPVKNGLPAKSD